MVGLEDNSANLRGTGGKTLKVEGGVGGRKGGRGNGRQQSL